VSPYWGPLDWAPGQFLDDDGKLIVCATHAALFRIHDDRCIAGPMRGRELARLEIVIDGCTNYLDEKGQG
jgi:nitrite reductase/ring-hydroxylating ferredoxin subunit